MTYDASGESGEARSVSRLKRVLAREVWPREEHDLTPWLADNLDVLEDKLGFGLTLVQREHRVGSFELDLLLQSDDNRVVIVENQFGRSNHGHLGQLLAYAAGTDADVVIWLAESFSDEHRAALDWLNESTGEAIAFFAVTLGAVRIGDSPPAPVIDVVVRPNAWVKQTGPQRQAAHREMRRDYDWQSYLTDAGHPASKVDVVRSLAELVERSTDWTPTRFKNQITYRSTRAKVLAIQFWGNEVRIEVFGLVAEPRPNPLAPLPVRAGSQETSWYWRFGDNASVPSDLSPLVAMLDERDRGDDLGAS